MAEDVQKLPKRKHLPHEIPSWVPDGETFFITICCKRRGGDELLRDERAKVLLDSVGFYQEIGKWWCHLFLLMPDHLHGFFVYPGEISMRQCIASWKSHHARKNGIIWQDGFFDHRIRNDAEYLEKAAYIRNNPVRAGLVHEAKDWPHVYSGSDLAS